MGVDLRRRVVADFGDEDAVRDGGDNDREGDGKQSNARVHSGDALNRLEPDGKVIN